MAAQYTIQYPTTGQRGARIVPVINWYGRFATEAEASAYLSRVNIKGGRVVPYPAA